MVPYMVFGLRRQFGDHGLFSAQILKSHNNGDVVAMIKNFMREEFKISVKEVEVSKFGGTMIRARPLQRGGSSGITNDG